MFSKLLFTVKLLTLATVLITGIAVGLMALTGMGFVPAVVVAVVGVSASPLLAER